MEALFHLSHAAQLIAASAAGNLVSAIWEGAVLAAAVALCLRIVPQLSAASRSLVWLNVFVLLALLQILPVVMSSKMSGGAALAPVKGARWDLDPRWSLGIAGAWALLSLWRGAQLVVSAVRLQRMASRSIPLTADAETEALLKSASGRRLTELCTSDEVVRPSVLGFFSPRILLPPALVDRLSPQELRQVVVHEMEHLRRADDWTNLLQKIALVLFPLNPVLLWVERRVCAERELACDDRVRERSGGGKAYAICLTHLAEYSMMRRGLSLALGAWERRPELARRVHRMLRRPKAAFTGVRAVVATASLTMAVLAGEIVLSRSPQLVGFSERAPREQADLAMTARPALFQAMNASEGAGAAHIVAAKAVIPERTLAQPTAVKKCAKRQRALPAAPAPDTAEQTWMVLTDWNELAEPPRPVLLKLDVRGSYAAVPVVGGWLILRI